MEQPPPSAPSLHWTDEFGIKREFLLLVDRILIGRRTDAHIVLNHRLVSRQHAEIIREQTSWVLIDLKSTHGTHVNSTRVERHVLTPHDLIEIGHATDGVQLRFLNNDEPQTIIGRSLLDSAGLKPSVKRLAQQSEENSELERIASLMDLHYYFGRAFSAEKTFHQIVKSALQISGAERGFILRNSEEGFTYALGLDVSGLTLNESEFRTSTSAVEQVTRTGEPVFMTQGLSSDLADQESIVAMNLRAIACLPLESVSEEGSATITGILYLDSRNLMHSLSGLDQKLIMRLAGDAGNVLEKIQLIESLAEGRRIDQELANAEETQRTLLPLSLPEFPPFAIKAFFRATRQLGGDFYDFITLPNHQIASLLGDVSGKGIPAALLASLSLGALNMEFRAGDEPAEILSKVNNLLFHKIPSNRFVTLFLFLLDANGKGQFLSAGHNTVFLYRAHSGKLEELSASGLPLGMFEEASYGSFPFDLNPGDTLVVYSDGLTDAENSAGEDFGEDRLKSLIQSLATQGAEALRAGLMQQLDLFTKGAAQNDDITFLLVEYARLSESSVKDTSHLGR